MEEYRKWYESNRPWLCLYTPNLDDFMRHLRAAGLLVEDKQAEIENCPGPQKKRELLYDYLVRLGSAKVEQIIHCLDESDQSHTADKFRGHDFCDGVIADGAPESGTSSGDHEADVCTLETSPCAPVDNFVGRTEEKNDLLKNLTTSEGRQRKILVTGLPGVGKSDFVRYVLEEKSLASFRKSWLTGDTAENLLVGMYKLSRSLGIPGGQSRQSLIDQTKSICAKILDRNWIIVFDNVDNEKPYEDFVKVVSTIVSLCKNCFVIITSRNMKVGAGEFQPIPLKELDTKDAIKFVTKALESRDPGACPKPEDVVKLCRVLQNFPLGLQTATAMIRRLGETIPQYLVRFDEASRDCLEEGLQYSSYTLSTFTVLKASIDQVKKGPASATDTHVLNLISFLHPDHISFEYLKRLYSHVWREETEEAIRGALNNLVAWNLVTRVDRNNSIRIHRLVQEVTRILMAHPKDEPSLFGKAIEMLKNFALRRSQQPEDDLSNVQILDSLITAHISASDPELGLEWRTLPLSEVEQVVAIWYQAAKIDALLLKHAKFPFAVFKALSKYSVIAQAHEFSLIVSSRFAKCGGLDEKDEDRVRMEFALTKALQKKGEYQEAYNRVRALYDKMLLVKPEEEVTNWLGQDLASLLGQLNRPEEALQWNEKVLAIRMRQFPVGHARHIRTVRILHNKGIFLGDMGQHKEALPYFEDAYKFFVGERGPDSDVALLAKHNIARTQALLGNYAAAIPTFIHVNNKRRERYSESHVNIMRTEYWLAYSLYHRDKEGTQEAKNILKQLCALQKEVLGEGHQHTRESVQLLTEIQESLINAQTD